MSGATVSYRVQFRREPAPPAPEPVGRVPRVAKLLALAHHFDRLVREGVVRDYAEIARLSSLTRARVSQLQNLTLLCPTIQEEILHWPPVQRGRDPITERNLRAIVVEPLWERQLALWRASSPACRDEGKNEGCPS